VDNISYPHVNSILVFKNLFLQFLLRINIFLFLAKKSIIAWKYLYNNIIIINYLHIKAIFGQIFCIHIFTFAQKFLKL